MSLHYNLQEQFETLALAKFSKGETLFLKEERRLTAPLEVTETYAVDAEDLKTKLITLFRGYCLKPVRSNYA